MLLNLFKSIGSKIDKYVSDVFILIMGDYMTSDNFNNATGDVMQVKVLNEVVREYLPKQATDGSAGFDLRACIDYPATLKAGECMLIPTGLAIYIEEPNLVGIIAPRSGLGHKHGIILGNTIGVIDSDYQGEIMVSLWNRSDVEYTINPLDRIAQYMVLPVVHPKFQVVDKFGEDSARGDGGFGHSGK